MVLISKCTRLLKALVTKKRKSLYFKKIMETLKKQNAMMDF